MFIVIIYLLFAYHFKEFKLLLHFVIYNTKFDDLLNG